MRRKSREKAEDVQVSPKGVNETHKLNGTSGKGKGKGMDEKENMEEREKMDAMGFSSRA